MAQEATLSDRCDPRKSEHLRTFLEANDLRRFDSGCVERLQTVSKPTAVR